MQLCKTNVLDLRVMTTLSCNSDGGNLERKRLTQMGNDDPLLTYGWKWEPTSTVDENYCDLCSLVTRNSTCIQGQVRLDWAASYTSICVLNVIDNEQHIRLGVSLCQD